MAIPLTTFAAEPPLNYEQHVQPILREHCFACHNQEKSKGGLALDSFGALVTGGAGGEVIYGGDLEGSRLWQLVNHEDEPNMPPDSPKLADKKLATIRSWIEGGAIERAGGKPQSTDGGLAFEAPADQSGPGAVPQGTLRQPPVYSERAGAIAAIACSPRAPIVAIGGQRQVSVYHTDEQRLLAIAPFPEGQVNSISFSRDGSLMVVGGGRAASRGVVALYDVATCDRVARLGDELDAVLAADISPSLQRVALGGPNRIVRLLNTSSGRPIHLMKRHTDWIMAVAFSPDGKHLVSADRQGGLWMWEADTGLEVQDFPGHKQAITGLSWRPDSKVFASCSDDGNVRLWNVDNGKQVRTWAAHPGGVLDVQFAQNGQLLTAGRDNKAKLWNGTAKELRSFPPLADVVLQVAFSHDGLRAFAADWAGQVRCWQTADGTELWQPLANPSTLEMRLELATQRLEAACNNLVRADESVKIAATEIQAQQAEIEKATVRLNDGWKIAAARKGSVQPTADEETARPDLEKLELQVRQLATKLNGKLELAKTTTQQLTAATQQISQAEEERSKAEEELNRFREHKNRLQHEQEAAQQLAQQTEEQFEAIEQERMALADLLDSAQKVASSSAAPPDAKDVAMEQTDSLETSKETSLTSTDWVGSILERGEKELALCDKRLSEAASYRAQAAQELARAKARIENFVEAFED